jgi:hypothetical protein
MTFPNRGQRDGPPAPGDGASRATASAKRPSRRARSLRRRAAPTSRGDPAKGPPSPRRHIAIPRAAPPFRLTRLNAARRPTLQDRSRERTDPPAHAVVGPAGRSGRRACGVGRGSRRARGPGAGAGRRREPLGRRPEEMGPHRRRRRARGRGNAHGRDPGWRRLRDRRGRSPCRARPRHGGAAGGGRARAGRPGRAARPERRGLDRGGAGLRVAGHFQVDETAPLAAVRATPCRPSRARGVDAA